MLMKKFEYIYVILENSLYVILSVNSLNRLCNKIQVGCKCNL